MNQGNNNTKDLSWEYIAGFFDGEGCIFYMHPDRPSRRNYVIMHMSQSDKNNTPCQVMEQIHEFLMNHGIRARITHYGTRVTGGGTSSPASRVVTSSAGGCRDWLIGMMPFLRVKQLSGMKALEFIETNFKRMWLTPTQINEILTLRKQGLGLRKIAQVVNVTHGTVRKTLIKHNAYQERFKPGKRPYLRLVHRLPRTS